ncbi:hypothetical protein [Sphingomonas sp. BK235]|uniref:hypothetical protein n=1 Tax=Sphingomonas sp. BK235 TaxID=2512131 RepID=UPI00104F86C2|nr:hypothetical protein [Sphingomonas sp. BK235]TCP36525.1 hypothetical protein EV292_10121 [Sphingomonas sp. BK235]
MRIPEIRDRMHELADEHGIPELHQLADETRRRSPLRRVRARWPRLTEHQKVAVREAFVSNPHLGVRELADRFHTSIGRISEAIRGKRE